MKHLLIIIVSILSFQLYAQDNTVYNSSDVYQQILFGGSASVDYNYRSLKNTSGETAYDAVIKMRDAREEDRTGFTVGLNLGYNVNSSFGFETGLLFSQKGYNTGDIAFDFGSDSLKYPEKYHVSHVFNYLDVPLRMNVFFGKGKLRFLGSLGVIGNFMVGQKQLLTNVYHNGATEEVDQSDAYSYKKIGFTPTASIGIDLRIKKYYYFRLEPVIRYGVTAINSGEVADRLWNAGVRASVYYGIH
ncbi:MAG TPA: outer membrane beta-barrel protein [Saprospiraceae bacterium]|nr:outer membrane beta-barrel protein [Saprospiraceae bacterium]